MDLSLISRCLGLWIARAVKGIDTPNPKGVRIRNVFPFKEVWILYWVLILNPLTP